MQNSSFAVRALRRCGYGLIAAPLDLLLLLLVLVGRGRTGADVRWRAARLLSPAGTRRPPPSYGRVVGGSLLSLPVDAIAFLIAAVAMLDLVIRGFLYPLWYAGDEHRLDWGGPTLIGRWAAHVGAGLPTLVLAGLLLFALGAVQSRVLAAPNGSTLSGGAR